jgi:hypothetical protein
MQTSASTAGPRAHLVTECALIDEVYEAHRAVLGPALEGMRNHAYRTLNLARHLAPDSPGRDERLAVAATFHDLPAFFEGDLEYLDRAADMAEAHLRAAGHDAWVPEVRLMIRHHHKVRPYRGPYAATVDAVRRADWVDVTGTALRAGFPRGYVGALGKAFPLTPLLRPGWCMIARYAVRHPRRPLPMLQW